MSYNEALKIHGYKFSEESSSGEDSKSVLDEDYYRLQPSPIPVRRLSNRIIKIKVGDKTQQKCAFNKSDGTTGVSLQENTIKKRKNSHKSKFVRKSTSSANSNWVNTKEQINSCTFRNKYHTSNSALFNTTVGSRPVYGNSSNLNLNWQEPFKLLVPTEIIVTPTTSTANQNLNAIQPDNFTFKELHSKQIRRHARFSTTETPSSSTNDVNVSKNITARVLDNKTSALGNSSNQSLSRQEPFKPPIQKFELPTEIIATPTTNQNRNAIQTDNSTFKELHSKQIRRHTGFSTTETPSSIQQPSSSTNDVNVSKNITARVLDNKTSALGNSSNQSLSWQEPFKPPIQKFELPTEVIATPTRSTANQNQNAIQTDNSTFKELHSKQIRRHTGFSTTETPSSIQQPSSSTNDVNVSRNITAKAFDIKTRSSKASRKFNTQIAVKPSNSSKSDVYDSKVLIKVEKPSCSTSNVNFENELRRNKSEITTSDQASRTSHSFIPEGQLFTDVVCEPALQSVTDNSTSTNQEVSQERNEEQLQPNDSSCMSNICSILFCCWCCKSNETYSRFE